MLEGTRALASEPKICSRGIQPSIFIKSNQCTMMSNEISRSHWLIMRLSNPSSQRNPRGMNKLRDGAAVSQAGPKLPSNSFTVKRICNLSNPTKRILPIHLLEKNQTTKGFSGGQCLKFTGWFVLALYFFISDDAGDTKKNTKSPWVLDKGKFLIDV